MVDYSKWKDIEISDDEDDTHPNIDTPSLFKWRHEARMERMKEQQEQKKKQEQERKRVAKQKEDLERKLKESDSTNMEKMKAELKHLESEAAKLDKEKEKIEKEEKKQPWNVDTIGKVGFSKTIMNTEMGRGDDDASMTEEQKEERLRDFIKKYEKEMKAYGMLKKFDDSRQYLSEHLHLVCEDTANYLVIWCVNLGIEEKFDLMDHVAHQTICMQFILELAKQLDINPKSCVSSFFARIQKADKQYQDAFDDELRLFKERIRKRAAEKVEKALEEAKHERLGPGGLDPVEVFESLPPELQKCFETQDIAMLQQIIPTLPEEEARYHMKRCVDSGLWVPEANKSKDKQENGEQASAEEPVYEAVGEK